MYARTSPDIDKFLRMRFILLYKYEGAYAFDATGTTENVEFMNISEDDVLAYPVAVHRTYPVPVVRHVDDAVRLFVRASRWRPTRR